MKKFSFYLLVVCLFGIVFSSFNENKKLKVEMPFQQWDFHFRTLNGIKEIAEKSNLPHQEVRYIIGAVDSLQFDILKQLQPQMVDTTKRGK